MKVMVDTQNLEIRAPLYWARTARRSSISLLDVIYAGAPYAVVRRAMRIHATVSELIPTLPGELAPLA